MARRIVLCLSHSIEEHDQLKLLSSIGHDVFSIGGYINPGAPHDDKRPPLPELRQFPELQGAVDALGTPDNLGTAQERIPDTVLEWADTIIFHHYLDRLYGQWPRIKDWLRGDSNRRVIWRSVGQSVEGNERTAAPFRREGLERVAYSPKEQNIPGYSGHDALIRFYADPEEWGGWTGEARAVIQFTQHLKQRDPYTNYGFWREATRDLPAIALGPGSEAIGGPGVIGYDKPLDGKPAAISIPSQVNPPGEWTPYDVTFPNTMHGWLRHARAVLYTGTQPASYTLGLLEALMTGIPVISIGPSHMRVFPYGPALFEGHELASGWTDSPETARIVLQKLIENPKVAADASAHQRARAIEMFGVDKIRAEWAAYLA